MKRWSRDWMGRLRQRRSGFTLVELIVAITLLGILVTLGIPSFTGWIRNSQIRTVAEALQTGVRTAQAESVRRNRQVVMWFTNGSPTAGGTPVVGGKNWGLQTIPQFGEAAGEYITGGKFADIASAVSIANDMASNAICFNSAGRLVANTSTGVTAATCPIPASPATAATFNITLTGADRPLRVLVQLGGQLRMCDPNRPTTAPDGCP